MGNIYNIAEASTNNPLVFRSNSAAKPVKKNLQSSTEGTAGASATNFGHPDAAEKLWRGCEERWGSENLPYNRLMQKRTKYQEALRDPRWQRKRLEIMQRDGWACQFCAAKTDTLNVHHRWYTAGAAPWECPDIALVTLCETCHEDETFLWTVLAKRLVAALKSSGVAHGGLAVLIDALEGQRLSVVDADILAHRVAEVLRTQPTRLLKGDAA